MSLLRDHECRDCPANEKMCAHHKDKFCKGYAAKTWTILMARQAAQNTWDGNFRFPREHINGKPLDTFSVPELILMRNHYRAVWEFHWQITSKIPASDRPRWSPEVRVAHEIEVMVAQELSRRKRNL